MRGIIAWIRFPANRSTRWARGVIAALVVVIVLLIPVILVARALSGDGSGNGASLKADKWDCIAAVPQGGLVVLKASGFTPRGQILLQGWHNDQPMKLGGGTKNVNVGGRSVWLWPCSLAAGKIKLQATDRDSGRSATVTFTVPRKLSK